MKAPTQLELMALYDGELDEARAREVRSWLASNGEGAALVDSFRALGRHVRKAAPLPAPPADLADRIFAALDAEPVSRAQPQAAPAEVIAPVVPLRPAASGASSRPAPLAQPAPSTQPLQATSSAPAARPLSPAARVLPVTRRALGWAPLSAAGMALAAAAAFMLWWSPGGFGTRGLGPGASGKATMPSNVVLGTDVDTVDFGSRMGSLFFVSSDTQATPVLWLDDDDDDGESDESE